MTQNRKRKRDSERGRRREKERVTRLRCTDRKETLLGVAVTYCNTSTKAGR